MGTGAKVAIGCTVAVVLAGGAVIVALGVGGFWLKGKKDQFVANENQIEAMKQKANANRFTPPADGTIAEDRLLKFLEVRKRVYAVYQQHQAEFEAMKKKEHGDFSDLTRGVGVINVFRVAQAQAMSDVGMSDSEYRYLVENVYKTMWAAEVAKSTGGKSVSEAAGEAYDKAAEQMGKAEADAAEAEKSADTESSREAREARKSMQDGLSEMRKQAEEVRKNARQMDVPPANVALFRKHEAEIKQYAMTGLEFIGL